MTLYQFNPATTGDNIHVVSTVQLSEPLSAIGWTRHGSNTEGNEMGLLLAGHLDGKLSLWSPTLISQNQTQKANHGMLELKKGLHKSKVTSIQFNVKPNVCATSSTRMKLIQLVDTDGGFSFDVAMECDNSQDQQEITCLSWNDKVQHIIAVSSSSGIVYVWDMKKQKIHLKIRDQSMTDEPRSVLTTSLWATDGVQLIIAYDDHDYTFLTQYHMTQLNAPYAEYHGGHNKAVFQMCKNPNDANFLLSLGRDNIVTCWSMRTVRE